MRYNLATVVWGEEFTNFFTDVALPNLLTPGNLDALCGTSGSIFRIWTTEKDAAVIKASPAFKKVSGLLTAEINMINDTDFTQNYALISKYHKKAIDAAIGDNGAILIIGPDVIRAEGYMYNLLRIAQSGKRAVMVSDIRVAKETFLPEFTKRFSVNGVLQGIPPRQLAKLALGHLHPLSKSLLWSSERFNNAPTIMYFEVPGEGILARCFHMSPAFISPLDRNTRFSKTLDGDFVVNAYPDISDIYVQSDSDDLMSVEVSNLSYRSYAGKRPPNPLNIAAFAKYSTNGHNRVFVKHKIRFHFSDISPEWEKVERFSDEVIDRIFYWLKFEPLLFWPYGILLKARSLARSAVKLFLGESSTRKLIGWIRSARANALSSIKKFLRKIEFNRTVFFGAMGRMWGVISGPITALFIAAKFTPHLQGYYYTFWNLLALQVFVELGLGIVITQFASHEWSKLKMDRDGYLTGQSDALSKLSSLGRITLKWYMAGGVIVAVGLGIGGYIFFSGSAQGDFAWTAPWLALCLLTGLNICLLPIWSFLEGCNQVVNLYRYRFFQAVCTSFFVWMAILLGAGLWTASVSVIVTLVCAVIFLWMKYRNFLKSIFGAHTTGARIKWKEEIFPMQWRIALSYISGYFTFSLFTPVLFKFHGPIVAGQMGMTWSIIGFAGMIPGVWLIPKIPQFGMLIAQKDYHYLDQSFYRITKIFTAVTIMAAVSIWSLIYILNVLKMPIANRLLSPMPTAIFLVAQVIMMMSMPFSVYLRAHKKEPLLFPSVMLGMLIGASTIILGRSCSVMGIAIGYLLATSLVIPLIIFIWHRCRGEWHADNIV